MTRSRPLKILHIISGDLWAGAEVQAFTLLTALQKIPGVEVAAVLMNEGELAHRLRTCNVPVTILPETSLSTIIIFSKLCRLLSNWRPDVVHTHRIKENILGAIANRLTTNAPSVRTVHGAAEHPPKGIRNLHKHILNALNRWTGQLLQNRIVAVSAELATRLEHEFSRDKITVIENGVDIASILAQKQPTTFKIAHPASTHIGIVGRLVPVKRVDIFLEMASTLRQLNPKHDWRFHIFGDGPLRNLLESQAKQKNIEDITTFHGHRNDIVPCIAALDALVMCSDHEGLPMTALEALTLGTIVVAHSTGGLTTLLANDCGGRLISPNSADEYAKAIAALETTDKSSLQKCGTEKIAALYSSDINARMIYQLYREICPPRHP